ncbi:MAG: phosphotransferase [Acidobacteriota bacterium]|jgi:aminoglycoside phosphotransferase (APT) family kinase protein
MNSNEGSAGQPCPAAGRPAAECDIDAALPATDSRWLHGDLHARNVLVDGGVIGAIIDWGDLTAGDIATDLAAVWSLFRDAGARTECLARYQPDEAQLARAKGWAVLLGAVLLDTGRVDHAAHAKIGRRDSPAARRGDLA